MNLRLKLMSLSAITSLMAISMFAQAPADIDEKLLLENELVRVSSMTVTPTTQSIKRDRDLVIVLPLDGNVSTRFEKEEETSSQPRGAVFIPLGKTVQLTAAANSPKILMVELKKHWDVPVKNCAQPTPCVRAIRMGDLIIGETRTLFSNGFVTGFLHQLDSGGTLNSSYYSAKGEDHILLIPYTPVRVVLDGQELELQDLHPYFATVKEAEITGGTKRASWIVIRLNQPRPAGK